MSAIPRRTFGSTGVDVPVVGLGTWELERDRAGAVAALRHGLDLGLTHVDTAEMYGGGEVEELVAEAIAGRRDEVFLVSKVLPSNASRQGTIAACEASLRRLRTDVLDVYLLHWPSRHPLAETIAGFQALQAAGKIRAWGLSNFDVDGMEQAIRIAGGSASDGALACNQVLYHLEERAIEHRVLPFCREHGVALVAYSPFGSGSFPSPSSRGGRVLAEVAERHGATPRQVALAFLVRDDAVFAIPRSGNPAHVADNAAAASLALDEEDLRAIDAAFPRGREPRSLPTL